MKTRLLSELLKQKETETKQEDGTYVSETTIEYILGEQKINL